MLYKFTSKVAADVIYTDVAGRRILEAMGKAVEAKGIVTVAQMPDAIRGLHAAADADDAARAAAKAKGELLEPVSFRMRMQPMLELLQRAEAAEVPVIWGA
jgi:hypothetical protein